MAGLSDEELIKTIADFIELGHIENIIAMFKQEKTYYKLTGKLIQDERFIVRMGMAVLFEELVKDCPQDVHLAIPSLLPVLEDQVAYRRGEAINLLGIIGSDEAKKHITKMLNDPDPQVAEIANDFT